MLRDGERAALCAPSCPPLFNPRDAQHKGGCGCCISTCAPTTKGHRRILCQVDSGFICRCSPHLVWISYTQMVAPRLPSTNSSANCGWRMATFKFHLLLFCRLLCSETHSSEAQARWDSDKFYHLWLVTSTGLDYFSINSLPNLIPINNIFYKALTWLWCWREPSLSTRCSISVRVQHLLYSEIPPQFFIKNPFFLFFSNKRERTQKPLRLMNSFPFRWDYVQENSSLPKILHRWLKSRLISPPSFLLGCQPVSQ